MMKVSRILVLMGILALALAWMPGCSDDDDPTTPPQSTNPPTFSLGAEERIELPAGLLAANDPMANLLEIQMGLANSMSTYGGLFIPPGKAAATDGPPWVYTRTVTQLPDVNLSIILTIDETATAYTWTYVIDGFDEDGTYDNVVFYTAQRARDRSSGSMTINDWDTDTLSPAFSWLWATSTLGVFTMEMRSHGDDGFRLLWEILPDGSGTLDMFDWFSDDWRIAFHFDWTALGSGNWIQYNYDGGSNTTGSWSAGVPMKN